MANRYRSKPTYVDAVLWDGSNAEEVLEFVGKRDQPGDRAYHHATTGRIYIPAVGGGSWAWRGEYIIRGSEGGFFPCPRDSFADTYESVAA